MMSPEMITKIVEAVVTVILLLISAYVIPWLKNKIGEDKYNQIIAYCEKCVRAAEQIFTEEEREQKKQYVEKSMVLYLEKIGYEISVTELNTIIEASVNYIKYGMEYTR